MSLNQDLTPIVFLSFVGPDYSRSATLFSSESLHFKKHFILTSTRTLRIFLQLRRERFLLREAGAVLVMSPCHKITLLARVVIGKRVILDAGWPLLDGVFSRGITWKNIFIVPFRYSLDYVAFHSASLILLESQEQLERVRKHFFVRAQKLKVSYTGLNENRFKKNGEDSRRVQHIISKHATSGRQILVMFRGKLNKESGIEQILEAANLLTREATFVFLSDNKIGRFQLAENCYAIVDALDSEIASLYRISDIALGQLSNHARLKYSIPHKAFEADFFGIPYITPTETKFIEFLRRDLTTYLDNTEGATIAGAIRSLSDTRYRGSPTFRNRQNSKSGISQAEINKRFEVLLSNFISLKKSKPD